MLTSRKISVSLKKLDNFREFRWKTSTTPSNVKYETFWVIRTNVRREKFIWYLKVKFLVEGLGTDELQMLIDCPSVMKDNLFFDALRAQRSRVSTRLIGERLTILNKHGLGTFSFNLNLYYTFRGTIAYQTYVAEKPIGKFKKFSGYVRNSSSVGSKRQSGTRSEPENFQWKMAIEYDYYTFLTVGELTTGASGGSNVTLKSSERTKRQKPTKDPEK